MSGIARMLVARGDAVSGSDLSSNRLTQELIELGVRIETGHQAEWIEGCDVVVRSSAITEDNPEIKAARESGKPVMGRAELLSDLMENFQRIAIAGSHGKTTTTSLAASLLIHAELDPSYVIGGVLHEQQTNAYLGTGKHIIVEADESDASFLNLNPHVAIITNIDSDHLATYDDDINKLEQAFVEFVQAIPEDGLVIACADDERVMRVIEHAHCKVVTYSTEPGVTADVRADIQSIHDGVTEFVIDGQAYCLSMPGKHNVSNALACIALADHLTLSTETTQQALKQFRGVGRRFDTYKLDDMTVIDDYGHHPREISMTLQAARHNWPNQKICLVFQPHRYTRTQQLFDDFVETLKHADELILMDLYTANEAPIAGADSDALAKAVMQAGLSSVHRIADLDALIHYAKQHFGQDEIIILQGAGSIGAMVHPFLDAFHVSA